MPVFTTLFALMLFLSTGLKVFLDLRQISYVGHHRSKVPSAFQQAIDLQSHQKAADYAIAKTRLNLVQHLYDGLILLFLTFGGGLLWIDEHVHVLLKDLTGSAAFILCVFLLLAMLDLPFEVYRIFGIEKKFGFNRMTPGLFVRDTLLHALVGLALGLPLLMTILWIMQTYPNHWWIAAWLVFIGFNLIVLALYPTFIAPLFNHFQPLSDDSLKNRINALLEKCGFKVNGLFVMDGSTRSSHGNAYFTGLGKSRRIVFFDTLFKQLEPDEVLAVLAHELGHYKLHHVHKRIALMFIVSFFGLWLLAKLMTHSWFFTGLYLPVSGNAEALILFLIAGPIFLFPFTPIGSWYSRRHEYDADAYATRQIKPDKLVNSLVKLFKDNASTLTPDPLFSLFYDSHPGAQARINRLREAESNT
ncbi:MAG TPA: M48 family metallopeptidase [Burkholderiales bacterium]|nr:M48 family metallopeptidase [Burkholderiales bacterium]